MPKLIVTCRYLKSGSAKNLSNYVKYIATREGSVTVNTNNGNAPATEKCQELIASLVKEFPESKDTFEYADYRKHPTQKKATALIEEILEHNADRIANRENYVEYLAKRPGAVQFGTHGLFSQEDTPIDLEAVMQEVANHGGNVWTHVVSLRRDDAQRMGYDTLNAWRELIKRQIPNIARQSKIDLSNLKWYAAFHDKETNPHVHIIIYSTDPKEGFLTNHGIEKIRSGFANDIYSDELHHLYEQQTAARDQLKRESDNLMKQLATEMQYSSLPDNDLMQLVLRLHQQLAAARGKKVYKYLKPDVKRTVDAIFEKLAEEPHIQQMYSLWCDLEQTKHDMYSSAKINFPSLADNPTFQSVKNMIIKSVKGMQLISSEKSVLDVQPDVDDMLSPIDFTLPDGDDSTTELETDVMSCYMKWPKAYKRACELLHKNDMTEEEKQECLRLLTAEAEKGNVLALYDLGRVYASGLLDETDTDKSEEYYRKAFTGFLELEATSSKQRAYLQYCIGKMYAYGLGTAQNKTKAFEWFQKSAEAGNSWAELRIGRMLLFGAEGVQPDRGQAVHWLTKSSEEGNTYASSLLDNMKQFENQIVADSIFGLFVNLSRMIEEDYDRGNRKLHSQVDSKLRQVIRRKKMELGVKNENSPIQNY